MKNSENRLHKGCVTLALPFALKKNLKQKKNYGNSNISTCKKYNLPKNPLKEIKILKIS
jgi:predicted translin family RNA/ssDNA-binding protein